MQTSQTSRFIARLIGPLLLAIGTGMLVNADIYREMSGQFLESYALIYLSGLLALLGGLTLVNTHNVWAADWRVVITLLGWATVFGGVVRIILPQQVETVGRTMVDRPGVMLGAAVVILALGAWLSFNGYRHMPSPRQRGAKK